MIVSSCQIIVHSIFGITESGNVAAIGSCLIRQHAVQHMQITIHGEDSSLSYR
jgi:hypothetical protein